MVGFPPLAPSIEGPVLVHYGSFETKFLRQMLARYGGPPEDQDVARAIATPVNLLSKIFARIYFPAYSNGLKDVARYLGFNWSEANASGILICLRLHVGDDARRCSQTEANCLQRRGLCSTRKSHRLRCQPYVTAGIPRRA